VWHAYALINVPYDKRLKGYHVVPLPLVHFTIVIDSPLKHARVCMQALP
jgi:hypothetical protein